VAGCHFIPSHDRRTTTPELSTPAAQAEVLLVANTEVSVALVPLGVIDHAIPFQCKMRPASPTAHTSSEELPDTLQSIGGSGPPMVPSVGSVEAVQLPPGVAGMALL
jgi:hypothetical protein